MKPNEFWNCTYIEALLYVDSNSLQRENNKKDNIVLLEQYGNKIIEAFSWKKPKNRSLIKDIFKELFEEELNSRNEMSVEEMQRNMRKWNDD